MRTSTDSKTIRERPVLDQERQQKAREYSWIQLRTGFGESGLSLALLLILILTPLTRWFISLFDWPAVPLAVIFFVTLTLAYESSTFPLMYYTGHILPRRYGLSTQRLKNWMVDLAKGGSMGLIFG